MKKLPWIMIAFPVLALAVPREDFAWQWPVNAEAESGAYSVVIDDAVYTRAQSPELLDIDVLDAAGNAVPAAVFAAPATTGAPAWSDVPWFEVPAGPQSRDVSAISEIATDGSVRRVEWRNPDSAISGTTGILIDASQVRAPLHELQLQWTPGNAPMDRGFQVLASDDLQAWRVVREDVRLVDLNNQGRRVLRDRIALDGIRARYLRLIPTGRSEVALAITGARIATVAASTSDEARRWRTLSGTAMKDERGQAHFEFELDGRFPIDRVDVQLPGNSSQEWRLEARERSDAPWQGVAGPWLAYRLQQDASPAQALAGVHRDRHWRLTPVNALGDAVPQLRLGYRAETLVFVAQGAGPYAVVAGSARARRADAPVSALLETQRAQRGAAWQPPTATLGAAQPLAGDAALVPAHAPRDWKSWLLWGLLIAGALLVTGFALSLLRKPAQ